MRPDPLQWKLRFIKGIRPDSLFHALFDHLREVCLFAKDVDGHLLVVNRVLLQHFGFHDERQIIGKTDHDLFSREIAEKYRADDRRVMASRQPMLNIVELFLDAQGIPAWHLTNKLPIFAHDGQVAGIMGTIERYEAAKLGVTNRSLLVAFEHIRQHCVERIAIEDLARNCGLSVRQFERKFQEQLWMTPRELIMKMRVQRACEKLRQTQNHLRDLALDCGFYDQSVFTRQFKKHTGITPSQYRSRYG